MNKFLIMKYSLALVCVALFVEVQICAGIDVPSFFERRCSRAEAGFVTHSFENWIGNLTAGTPLYFPMLAKLDLLRLSEDLFKTADLGFLTGQEVLNSCINVRASSSPPRLSFTGYCGRSFSKVLTPEEPKVFSWVKQFPEGLEGSFRISLSDSKSWQLVDVCWGDGQRSWAVISKFPRLPSCTERVIIEHLKAIGFNENYFTGLQYESCENGCFRNMRG